MPKVDCSPLAKLIAKLALNIGSRHEIADLNAVLTEMKKHIPEIDRKAIVDSINEAHSGDPRKVTDLQKKLADLKREAKDDTSLRATIDQYQKAIAEGRQPAKAKKPTPSAPAEIAKLRAERDGLKEQLRAADPAAREKVKARIAELDAHLKAGTAPPKSVQKSAPADLQAIRDKRDDLMRQVREASPERRKQVLTDLREQIQELNKHIAAGTVPPKGAAKVVPADVAALRSERDKLSAQLAKDSPEALAKIQARITELEGHLKAGTLPTPKPPSGATVPDKVQAMRVQRQALMDAIRKSDPALRKRFEEQIAQMTARIDAGDFTTQPKAPASPMSKELETLAYRRDRLRKTINQNIAAMKPKTFWQKAGERIGEPINIARSLVTSMDLSAVLRQGGFIALGHPVRAAKAFPDMFRAFASPVKSHAINEGILNRPNAPLYARSKLYLAPEDGSLGKQEEAFMSRLAGKIPLVAGSQRAYTTFLNNLRADSFDAMVETLGRNGEATQAEAKAIANYINVATGRGSLGPAENAGQFLSTVFFAPRYVASRFQMLAGQPLYGGTARTRTMIAGEYAKYLTGMAVVYGLGQMAGGDIESDPRSSDFGKIKFGDTHVDPLSGISQVSVLLSRLATGETKKLSSGKIEPIRGEGVPFGGMDSAEVVTNFLRSKLAPVPGGLLNLASGKNVVGEPVGLTETARDMLVPLSFRDIKEAMEAHGVPEGTAISILSLFGMGIQHYEPKEPKPNRAKVPVTP